MSIVVQGLLGMIFFYVPNILQTLLITLNWPINFYFVKACVFILVLSLTRNVSYFSDKVPKDFLATSTTVVQCRVRYAFKGSDVNKIFNMTDEMDEMKTKIDRMQTKIDEMQKTINEMKNING
ncbi:unnamed protein product [Rhizophagus irregularis]|uniref:Uncharacterized protein n=1 Tax=Rhizophagus irregularis TaxID=588596 RepID=A0A2N1NJY7_9GLOM|nr:hypothetical protein RhiirC2_775048 [Rhizophagus irregularis]CAB4396092.1 unnamed protein product [Rhizophagus irregularis]